MAAKRKSHFVGHKVEVHHAGKKGRGIFASKNIARGEVIEVVPYLPLSARDHEVVAQTDLIRFIFDAGRGTAAVGLGFASLYNHSTEPNAEYDLDTKKRMIRFTASHAIKAGEEVTIDYGYHPALSETWPSEYTRYMNRRQKQRK